MYFSLATGLSSIDIMWLGFDSTRILTIFIVLLKKFERILKYKDPQIPDRISKKYINKKPKIISNIRRNICQGIIYSNSSWTLFHQLKYAILTVILYIVWVRKCAISAHLNTHHWEFFVLETNPVSAPAPGPV